MALFAKESNAISLSPIHETILPKKLTTLSIVLLRVSRRLTFFKSSAISSFPNIENIGATIKSFMKSPTIATSCSGSKNSFNAYFVMLLIIPELLSQVKISITFVIIPPIHSPRLPTAMNNSSIRILAVSTKLKLPRDFAISSAPNNFSSGDITQSFTRSISVAGRDKSHSRAPFPAPFNAPRICVPTPSSATFFHSSKAPMIV